MNKEQINENGLDELLRDLYLEENSHALNEREAAFVLTQEYPVNIDPGKELELLKRLNKKPVNKFGAKFYLALLAILIVGIMLLVWFIPGPDHKAAPGNDKANDHTPGNTVSENTLENKETNNLPDAENSSIPLEPVDTFGRPKAISSLSYHDSILLRNAEPGIQNERTTGVPYLADKDRLLYKKIKEQMIVKLLQSDKDLYTHVPANKMNYAGRPLIYDAFTIRNVQITNLEYKTFLADLLVQKRDEDYLAARVFPENWAEYHYMDLAGLYFQSEAYNDFPVVTVTVKGAALFCKWLEEETALYIKQNKLKAKPLKIRLPFDEEWIAAAREGYAKIAFEKGYNTLYDETENLVDGSFVHRIEIVKKRMMRIDSLYPVYTMNKYGWSEKELTAFFAKGIGYYNSIPADTICTPRMKVLGKTGRVSEIVLQKRSSKIWLAGLSWKSRQDYRQLENEFMAHTVSPFVGFRIVAIDPDDPEYKSPFW